MTPDGYVYAYELPVIVGSAPPTPYAYVYAYEDVELQPLSVVSVADAYAYAYEKTQLDQIVVATDASEDGYTYAYENVAASASPNPTALKVWDGTQWVAKPRYVWNGTSWVQVN